jgi:hypothetical protein
MRLIVSFVTAFLLIISDASFAEDRGNSWDAEGNAILTPQQLFHRCMIVAARSFFSNGFQTIIKDPRNEPIKQACHQIKTYPQLVCVRIARAENLGPKMTIDRPGWYARDNQPLV